jgi:hypothetical protein
LEIQLLAQIAGFQVDCSEEWLSGVRPSDSTWGVVYVLRKI